MKIQGVHRGNFVTTVDSVDLLTVAIHVRTPSSRIRRSSVSARKWRLLRVKQSTERTRVESERFTPPSSSSLSPAVTSAFSSTTVTVVTRVSTVTTSWEEGVLQQARCRCSSSVSETWRKVVGYAWKSCPSLDSICSFQKSHL